MPARVFRDYDQESLDAQYDPRTTVEDAAPFLAYYAEASARARSDLKTELDLAYGPSERQRMDLFLAGGENLPVVVFIHGGGWQRLTKAESAFAARCFTENGAHFIALDFDVLPHVTLHDMVRQVREGIAWIYRSISQYAGDHHRLVAVGHSSGAHLAGMLLAEGWQGEFGLPEDVVKGTTLISGLYDLEPVLLSSRSEYVILDKLGEQRLSPLRQLGSHGSVIVCHSEYDTDEFVRQSTEMRKACAQRGILAASLEIEGRNHFDVVESLASPEGQLARAVLQQISAL